MRIESLKTCCVVVTRPAVQAESLVRRFKVSAAKVICFPGISIEPAEDLSGPERIIQDLDRYQHLVFTSVNAARFGMDLVDHYWPQWPVGLNWYAIGEATAKELRSHDIIAQVPKVSSSEGLLAMAPLQQISEHKVLIFKGVGGRTLLQETFIQRKAKVVCAEVYQRVRPEASAAALSEIKAAITEPSMQVVMVVSSVEILKNMEILLGILWTEFKHRLLIVVSERIAIQARKKGFSQVLVAASASDSAIESALIRYMER